MKEVGRWLEESPYSSGLGVRAERVDAERVHLALPFDATNSNGDTALHGGVAASMIVMAGQAVGRAALGADAGPWHTPAIQVSYLSAALGEGIVAEARLLRRGRELAFVDVAVATEPGKAVARGLVTVRGRAGAEPTPAAQAAGDDGGTDRGPMGPHLHKIPFHGKLGLFAERMEGGRSRICLPWKETNADVDGGVHEGAVLALLDTTGAMAAWAETGPGPYKASTPGIQARFLAAADRSDLVAYGHVRHRDRELLFSEVEIARASDRRLVSHGTVNYRIVTPDLAR